jgi:endonuclease/exonuclease/phosphatase family metal-dependent hydrolase
MRNRSIGGLAVVLAAGLAASVPSVASAQLRVCAWNLSVYGGGRQADLTTAFFAPVPAGLSLEGQSMSPDIVIATEVLSQTAVDQMVAYLNAGQGVTDWAAAPFINGPDTDAGFFYRSSKVEYLQTVIISQATGSTSLPPRHTYRYDVKLAGYGDVVGARLACYATHMKSSDGATDQQRRLLEANKVRDNANGLDTNGPGTALPPGTPFLIGGDFNIQSSSQLAYQRMVGSEATNVGRFFDPIHSPGSWNNNCAFRFIHTQDPSTSGQGGMDDRHDQILIGGILTDGPGFDYVGNSDLTFSTTTWDDPNHSYRCWGNDGSNCNGSLRVSGNTMVGPAISQALINVANSGGSSGGHLPVFLDLRVPARVDSDTVIDFGTVAVGSVAEMPFTVVNAGDVMSWGESGVADLVYSLTATSGFGAPGGSFLDAPGGAGVVHTVSMDTSTPGVKNGTLTITSDAPDEPVRIVTLVGNVEGGEPCRADFNGDQVVDFFDYLAFVEAFDAEDPSADFNGDEVVDFFDYLAFVAEFDQGCE